ncbi:MAG TPA: alpha/beta hydrolase [Myxococcaceae bacterium]|jgi:pimeloyl-ACP methyl ester carboxylesterase
MKLLPLSAALLLALACTPRSDRRAPSIPLRDCQLAGQSGQGRIQARCGTLQVPEDRSRPDGLKIDLRVAVIRARGVADPTPVFFLAGGPGQAATEQHLAAMFALSSAQRERDVVLVDQRGTGAQRSLRCDEPKEELDDLSEEAQLAAIDACVKQLRGDPRHYTTLDAARDLDAAREALGYSHVHLLGVSYGTRLALAYLREYPKQVKTAVLDGVVPMTMVVGEQMALTGQRALDLDLKRCASTPACAARFPDLPAAMERVLDRLQRNPEHVRLRHPTTGAPVEVTLTRQRFAMTTFNYSYMPELVGLLPLFIHGADATGDYSPVAAQSIYLSEKMESSISRPLHLSVICAEDAPFFSKEPPALDWLPKRSYLGDLQLATYRSACARWPHATVDPSFKEPVKSDVPVLLLSGEADPVTPPELAEEAKRTLSRSLHLVVKGHGHNVSPRGCLPSLIARVERDGSVDNLDTSCVADIAPAPMFLDFLGHEP